MKKPSFNQVLHAINSGQRPGNLVESIDDEFHSRMEQIEAHLAQTAKHVEYLKKEYPNAYKNAGHVNPEDQETFKEHMKRFHDSTHKLSTSSGALAFRVMGHSFPRGEQ